jgi:hypothetical protein
MADACRARHKPTAKEINHVYSTGKGIQ